MYKLEELDRRFKLLGAAQHVLDLGCRPGSWLEHAAAVVGARGHVVGLDRSALDRPPAPNVTVVVGDVLSVDPETLRAALPQEPRGFHVVLSDMAPDTTGIAFTDQTRSLELFLRALELALVLGLPGSAFVGKVFMGPGFDDALGRVKERYRRHKSVRPEATRRSSSEVYVVGLQRR